FSRLAGLPEIVLSGNGALEVQVSGPPAAPAVRARGTFAQLGYAQHSVKDLTLSLDVPNLRRPFDVAAKLKLAELQLADRRFTQIDVNLSREFRTLIASVTAKGESPFSLSLSGNLDRDARGLTLAQLSWETPQARWVLGQSAHLRFLDDPLVIEPILLRS